MTDVDDPSDTLIIVPPEELSHEVLDGLMLEFVTRDGTDYGEHELSLNVKVIRLRKQVLAKDVLIVFHVPTEQVTLVRADDLPAYQKHVVGAA
jgi:uncharacterized protein